MGFVFHAGNFSISTGVSPGLRKKVQLATAISLSVFFPKLSAMAREPTPNMNGSRKDPSIPNLVAIHQDEIGSRRSRLTRGVLRTIVGHQRRNSVATPKIRRSRFWVLTDGEIMSDTPDV